MYTYDESLKTTGSEMIMDFPISTMWLDYESYKILNKLAGIHNIRDLLTLGKDNLYIKIGSRIGSLSERFEIMTRIESSLAMINLKFKDSDFDKTKVKLSYLNLGEVKKYISDLEIVEDLLLYNYKALWRSLGPDNRTRTANMEVIESALEELGVRLVGSKRRLFSRKMFTRVKKLEAYYKDELKKEAHTEPTKEEKPHSNTQYKTKSEGIKPANSYYGNKTQDISIQIISTQMEKSGFKIFNNFDYTCITNIDDIKIIKQSVFMYLESKIKTIHQLKYNFIPRKSIDALNSEIGSVYFLFISKLYAEIYKNAHLLQLNNAEYQVYQEMLLELGRTPSETTAKVNEILNSYPPEEIGKQRI